MKIIWGRFFRKKSSPQTPYKKPRSLDVYKSTKGFENDELSSNMNKTIYLDHAASTPPRGEVVDAMLRYLRDCGANPSSQHGAGQKARQRIEEARSRVAAVIGAKPEEIIFTSGGTAANNLALKGIVPHSRKRLITSMIEHASILNTAHHLSGLGAEVICLPCDRNGHVIMEQQECLYQSDNALISIGYVNNETGTIQNIAQLTEIKENALFHSDAVQALGRIKIDVEKMGVHLLSLSGHKIYGPQGVGALYCRKGIALRPLLHGGRQENEKQAGTENGPGIVGFGLACKLIEEEREAETRRLGAWRTELFANLRKIGVKAELNVPEDIAVPGIISLCLPNYSSTSLLEKLDGMGIFCSAGSACSAGKKEPSPVLLALGITPATAAATIRISPGKGSAKTELEALVKAIAPSC